ncbi:predicted protein [Botrytis cinerea T4]|uniref:Uncharacterized protein n=1 Tax=Botryotinia fuckeliana (strain T4) TaxID=999810 RepID=G2YC72_BOTF4|nr:predicted protein [Botrytis cinerea T4]
MMEEKRWKLCDVHCESMLDVFWLLSHSNVFLQEEVIFAGAIDGWDLARHLWPIATARHIVMNVDPCTILVSSTEAPSSVVQTRTSDA